MTMRLPGLTTKMNHEHIRDGHFSSTPPKFSAWKLKNDAFDFKGIFLFQGLISGIQGLTFRGLNFHDGANELTTRWFSFFWHLPVEQ